MEFKQNEMTTTTVVYNEYVPDTGAWSDVQAKPGRTVEEQVAPVESTGPEAVTGSFVKSLDGKVKEESKVVDEKGNVSLSCWGADGTDQRTAMFFKLVRDLVFEKPVITVVGKKKSTEKAKLSVAGVEQLKVLIRNVVAGAVKRGNEGDLDAEREGLVDLMVMMFQTRDIQNGKGERMLFYLMFLEVFR